MVRIFLFIFFLIFSPVLKAQEVWKIATLEWPPYVGSDLEGYGTTAQKLKEILDQEGIKLELDFVSWDEAKRLGVSEEYVGYFPSWPEDVYQNSVMSGAVDWSGIAVLENTLNPIWYTNIKSLFQKNKVGIVGSYTYPISVEIARREFPESVVDREDEMALMQCLASRECDAILTDPKVTHYYAGLAGVKNIDSESFNVLKKALVVAFRNDAENEHRIRLFQELLVRYKNREGS